MLSENCFAKVQIKMIQDYSVGTYIDFTLIGTTVTKESWSSLLL